MAHTTCTFLPNTGRTSGIQLGTNTIFFPIVSQKEFQLSSDPWLMGSSRRRGGKGERKQKERDWLWCNKLQQRWEEWQASWHCLKCVPWPLTDNVHYMCIVYRICCLLLRKVQSYKLKTDFTTKRTTKWQILVTWNHPTFCIKQTDM